MPDISGALDPIVEAIYEQYEKRGSAEPARTYLGASIIGKECSRALWYDFRWAARESFDGRMYRLFQSGFVEEPRLVAALAQPKVYAVDSVEYDRHVKIGKAPSLKVTYWCGPSAFVDWVPIEDERSYVRKHAIYWFYQRGLTCPLSVDQAMAMIEEIPAPDTITVKLDGKYWRVVDTNMGSRRMDISKRAGDGFWGSLAA